MKSTRSNNRFTLYFDDGLYFIKDDKNQIDSYSFDLDIAEFLEIVDEEEFNMACETIILETVSK